MKQFVKRHAYHLAMPAQTHAEGNQYAHVLHSTTPLGHHRFPAGNLRTCAKRGRSREVNTELGNHTIDLDPGVQVWRIIALVLKHDIQPCLDRSFVAVGQSLSGGNRTIRHLRAMPRRNR